MKKKKVKKKRKLKNFYKQNFILFNSPKPNQTKHLSHVSHIHDQTLIIDSVALALKKNTTHGSTKAIRKNTQLF